MLGIWLRAYLPQSIGIYPSLVCIRKREYLPPNSNPHIGAFADSRPVFLSITCSIAPKPVSQNGVAADITVVTNGHSKAPTSILFAVNSGLANSAMRSNILLPCLPPFLKIYPPNSAKTIPFPALDAICPQLTFPTPCFDILFQKPYSNFRSPFTTSLPTPKVAAPVKPISVCLSAKRNASIIPFFNPGETLQACSTFVTRKSLEIKLSVSPLKYFPIGFPAQ